MTAPHTPTGAARHLAGMAARAVRAAARGTDGSTVTGRAPDLAAMREATRLTRAGRLTEAMALLQGAGTTTGRAVPTTGPGFSMSGFSMSGFSGPGLSVPGFPTPGAGAPGWPGSGRPAAPTTEGGTVQRGSVSGPAGTRTYRLVVPSQPQENPPLVVMLHGGTQDADVFAAATGMDDLAEREGFVVVYPEQSRSANAMGYWNWFEPQHQGRSGEAALIARMIEEVAAAHGVDRGRVFVAGFSAGAAMAAVMGAAYPDLVAAVGVHSGLPAGAARDVGSAFGAMKGAPYRAARTSVPVIVVHGADDPTVAAVNGTRTVEAALAEHPGCAHTVEHGHGERSWTRERWTDRDGRVRAEQWTVHGSGHAWSGGQAGGSYTDPAGPDASAAMVEFFQVSTNGRYSDLECSPARSAHPRRTNPSSSGTCGA